MGGPVTFHENETWWDLGCGPFSATLAQLLLRGNRGGRVQIIGVDRADRVPKFAVKVLEQGFGGADINWKFVKGDLTTFIPRADKNSLHRAFITHALNESRSPDRFVKQLNAICHRIDAQTVFFLEPAKKEPFERLARVRDLFIDHEFSVLAPCTHNAACPMFGRPKDWCHFSTPLFEKLQWSRFSEQFFKGKTARNLNFSFVYLSREQTLRAREPLRIVTDVLRGRQGSFSYGCGVDGLIATQERGRGRLVDGP
jgi:hypothetical protein